MTISSEKVSCDHPGQLLKAAGLGYAVIAFFLTFAFFTYFVVFLGNLPKPSAPWVLPTADVGVRASTLMPPGSVIWLSSLFSACNIR